MEYKYQDNSDNKLDCKDMGNSFFLIGLLSEFSNRFQTVADRFLKEMSWKQCFVLICIRLFEQPPTLKELSDILGSSHQNVKQMLLKLEKGGYVEFVKDSKDKRKQRIVITEKTEEFNEANDQESNVMMAHLFSEIDLQDLETTIKTIVKLDNKLKEIKVDL